MKREILFRDAERVIMSVKHTDGITHVMATGTITKGEFVGEYKLGGMTYGITIPAILCDPHCDLVPNVGFENSVNGDVCRVCGTVFLQY